MRSGRRFGRHVLLLLALSLPSAASAALLSLADPLGDAVGDGSLTAPTAERFNGSFDLGRVTVLDAETFTFRLELAAPTQNAQAVDSVGPIIEVYLDSEPGGAQALLPGSGMRLASGGWEVAFQIVAGRLRVFTPDASGDPVLTPSLGARLTREGSTLLVTTPLETPERFSLYGMLGLYDPFSESGWRAVALEPAPWHPSSPTQERPVVDVIADDPALQARAIRSGVLPEIRTSFRQERWLLLASGGALVALLGLALRFFAPAQRAPEPAPYDAPADEHLEVEDPPLSYGAREAGERAQILREIDFETLRRGEWLEASDNLHTLDNLGSTDETSAPATSFADKDDFARFGD